MIAATLLLALPLQAVISDRLQSVLDEATPDERIRVIVVMRDRPDTARLHDDMERLPRRERGAAVKARLLPLAENSQAGLDALVGNLRQQGHVDRSHRLWTVNAQRLWATKTAIEAVAELPGVDRIKWDPVLMPSETQDIAPPRDYEISRGPYRSSFETSVIPPEFDVETTGNGRVEVRQDGRSKDGRFHLVMDSNEGVGTITADLHVDLSGAEKAMLTFDALTSGACAEGDGVWLSVNGVEFFQVFEIPASRSYDTHSIDLAATAAAKGIPLTSNVTVSFRWTANGPAPRSGVSIDDVEITTQFSSLAAEPNIVGHQADQLWAIGIDGSGVLILNVDSGVANDHPDLANGIWSNPGEIAGNSIDDDSNGFVDDTWGWNFAGNNNNPYGTGHGTNTAGIVAGDGTNNGGVCTGMAPGTTQAVTEISGEGDALASYQYAIDIGCDVITSSHSFKWPSKPDYHLMRASSEVELAAGVIHANSIGNQGNSTSSHPVPFNISTPGNCPGPWRHEEQIQSGGVGSVMACAGILLGGDALYTSSGRGPSVWEDLDNFTNWPHPQDPSYWDYLWRGGVLPGLLKPDVCTYTEVKTTNGSSSYDLSFGGTSAATPHLGGAMCLMVDANPEAPPRQISKALQQTAVDLGPAGKDTRYGAGKIQVYDAALRIRGLITAVPQENLIGEFADLVVTGPAGMPYAFIASASLGTIPTVVGFDLELANPIKILLGTHTGYSTPTIASISIDDPAFAGFRMYMQIATDGSTGPTGGWYRSVVEDVAWN